MCGSKKIGKILSLTPTPLCDAYIPKNKLNICQKRYPLDLFLCSDCNYVFIPYVVSPEEVYREYIYVTTSSMGLSEHFKSYAENLLKKVRLSQNSLVVDIGSNDGTLLKYFKKQKMKTLGIEPATAIAKKANNSGIKTIPKFFSPKLADVIINNYGSASIVTMNNLFANIDNLQDLAKGIAKLLSSDGVLVIESSYLADMINNMVFDFIYHEHLSYLSVKPIVSFFRRFKMEVFDIEHTTTKGGSLRYYIQLANGPKNISTSVNKLIEYEESIHLYDRNIYKNFAQKISNRKRELLKKLHELKGKDITIIGYGGSATSTTLIYHFEIGQEMDFIVDDNQSKHYTYSPGYHIPILPSGEIYKIKPDYIIVLAWRYFDVILKKHQKYLDQGGHFIVPLPNFYII